VCARVLVRVLTDVGGLVISIYTRKYVTGLLWIIMLSGIVTKIHILGIIFNNLRVIWQIFDNVKKSENLVHSWERFVIYVSSHVSDQVKCYGTLGLCARGHGLLLQPVSQSRSPRLAEF
jgi:hypothetical protein